MLKGRFTLFILIATSCMAESRSALETTLIWKGIYLNTMEHCRISHQKNLTFMNGSISGIANDKPVNVNYQISVGDDYQIRSVIVRSVNNGKVLVHMTRQNNSWFGINGKHLDQFDNCTDIDISLTPLTNTLPINRLHLSPGQSKTIDVIYIDPLKNDLLRLQQRYTRFSVHNYKYENLSSKFIANLLVDDNGFIIHYPGAWERIYPKEGGDKVIPLDTASGLFASTLISAHRSNELNDASDIYAPLLGNWKLTMIDYDDDGTKRSSTGIWYFARVLEGRAIQDVIVCPVPGQRSPGMDKAQNRYGTSFRTLDPQTHQWYVDFFNPVTGTHNELTAYSKPGQIIQETKEINGLIMRWIFEDIKGNSFHWYGEGSLDHGKTWKLGAEFFAKRMD